MSYDSFPAIHKSPPSHIIAPLSSAVRIPIHNDVRISQSARQLPESIRVPDKDFHLRPLTETSRISLYSHAPEQIAEFIRSVLPKSFIPLTGEQQVAITIYNWMRSQHDVNPEDTNLLLEYFHVFDQLFFRGALRGLCFIQLLPFDPDSKGQEVLGDFTSHRCSGFNDRDFDRAFEGRIRIGNLKNDKDFSNGEARLHQHLGTLLHEALHAIFEIYCCFSCSNCKRHDIETLGELGHGKQWQETAELIEESTASLHKGRLDLNISYSVAQG